MTTLKAIHNAYTLDQRYNKWVVILGIYLVSLSCYSHAPTASAMRRLALLGH
jgi:hypothetical protein